MLWGCVSGPRLQPRVLGAGAYAEAMVLCLVWVWGSMRTELAGAWPLGAPRTSWDCPAHP